MQDVAEFERVVRAIVRRFLAQNGRAAPGEAQLARFSGHLRTLVEERGLPRPLAAGETGAPGGMSEEESAPLVARVMAEVGDEPLLGDAAKQLVKACFYPEFKVCRDSFREVGRDGTCKRQQLDRVRGRTSGAHCVDCPHWVACEPGEHAELLASNWKGDVAEFAAHRDVFLPEDFRALRRWLYTAARQ